MMLNNKENAVQLRKLILERQKFESEHNISFPTTIDFRDIHGYALIHYAAFHNDIELMKNLILEKAEINLKTPRGSSPLELALVKGNIAVAEVLVENNAATENIFLYKISDLKCRQWFTTILTKNPPVVVKQISLFSKTLSWRINSIIYETNLNNVNYIKNNLKTLLNELLGQEKKFFIIQKISDIACCSGYLDIVKFLYEQCPTYYQQEKFLYGPLHQAISFNQTEVISFLWDKVKIIAKDYMNSNIFLYAIGANNNELARKLYDEHHIDVCAADILGNNAIIYAIMSENVVILQMLLSSSHKEKLLQQVNIYGETAKDFAQYSLNSNIRKLFNITETIAKKEPYSYAQTDLNPRMNFFLRLNYLDMQVYWDSDGMCAGYAPLFFIYAANEKLYLYRESFDLIWQWNGSSVFLGQQVSAYSNIPSADKVYDFLNGIACTIVWFQHGRELNVITHFRQTSREDQFEKTPITKPKIFLEFKKFRDFSYKDLIDQLSCLAKFPPGCCIELISNKHVVPIYIKSSSEIYYGDSNHEKLISSLNSMEKCAELFYQTVLLKEHLIDPSQPFGFKIVAYYFPEFELKKLSSQKFQNLEQQKDIVNFFRIGLIINDFDFVKEVIKKIPNEYLSGASCGIAPLLLCTAFPRRDVLYFLLESGLNINQTTQDGNTLLHMAINNSELDLFCFLLAHGADFNIKNASGINALDLLASASEEFQTQYSRYMNNEVFFIRQFQR